MAVHDGNADRSAAALPPVVPAAPRAVVKSASREPSPVTAKTSLPTVVLSDETHAASRHTRRLLIATVASGVVHATTLVLLGLWWLELPELSKPSELVATIEPREPERPITLDKPRDESPPPSLMPAARDPFVSNLPVTTEIEPPRIEQVGSITQQTTVTIEVPSDTGVKGKPGEEGGLAGLRSGAGRAAAGSARGATPESEEAVELALKWLVRHQQPDGTWNFDHRTKQCKGECDHPGTLVQGRVAATSLALLPFLGAGYTHRTGPYRKEVSRGLKFLERIVEKEGHAVELSGGGMYAHALATIVLCEAYGITGDRVLLRQAQRAIHFIPSAQDPVGGGWRYVPNQPGDTSVV
ncbi:MAG: terpene cyclase/mutase family protein, partial [Planctomycetaceae bacterium]|nr:terpene cyclase/mutase family protein [Planctomycetaceae bacterium]